MRGITERQERAEGRAEVLRDLVLLRASSCIIKQEGNPTKTNHRKHPTKTRTPQTAGSLPAPIRPPTTQCEFHCLYKSYRTILAPKWKKLTSIFATIVPTGEYLYKAIYMRSPGRRYSSMINTIIIVRLNTIYSWWPLLRKKQGYTF